MLYQFVDYCGTIHDVRKAWTRHIKLFPSSARIDLRQQSSKCRRSLNLIKDKREEICVVVPDQASRDSSSNLLVHLPQQNKKVSLEKCCDTQSDATNDGLLLMENHVTRFNDTDMIRLQIMESDDKGEDNARELPLSVSEEPRDNDPEKNLASADLVEVEEESTKVVKNFKNKWSESDVSSENLLHQTASANQHLQALQASSNENAVFSQGKCELQTEELKPLSVTSMSLNPHESTCPDSGLPTSQEECDTIPESSKSNSRAVVGGHTANQDNSASTQDSESAQLHVEMNSSFSTCHQDHRTRRPLLPPRFSRNSGGNRHQMRNAGKFHRGPKYGPRGYTHRKQHQRQQLSPQQIHPAEGGAQLPVTSGYSQPALQVQQCNQSQNQFQTTATPTDFVAAHSWPIQNIQMQNSLSQSQSPASTASHVLQHAGQGNGQYGYMQNGQEYNQMWQQYYYQQQQQQLQLQQHYIQLQQQSFQQVSQQQQSQLESLQPQQLQQLQLQQILQQQYFQQQQPQQQEQPVYTQQLQPSTQVKCQNYRV